MWKKTLLAAYFAIFSGSVLANTPPNDTTISPNIIAQNTAPTAHDWTTHGMGLADILRAEIFFLHGNYEEALNIYQLVAHLSNDSGVAQRGLELSILSDHYDLADTFYQQWQHSNPNAPLSKHVDLMRLLISDNASAAISMLPEALQESTEWQRRAIFLLLAKKSVGNTDLSNKGADIVHQMAQKYPDMLEAHLTDALFGLHSNRDEYTLSALQQLLAHDPQLGHISQLTIDIISQKNTAILHQFFQKNTQTLPEKWQLVKLYVLLAEKQFDEADALLAQLDSHLPPTILAYAASLFSQHKHTVLALKYWEKAYVLGDDTKKPAIATAAVISMLSNEHAIGKELDKWSQRIQSKSLGLSTAISITLAFAKQQQWQKANEWLTKAEKLSSPKIPSEIRNFIKDLRSQLNQEIQPPHIVLQQFSRDLAQAEKRKDTAQIMRILTQRSGFYAQTLAQPQNAIADLRRLVALDPDSADNLNALGYSLLILNDAHLDEAFALIEKAHQKDPEEPAINDSLGWAYHKKGENDKALIYLEYAYKNIKDFNPEVAAHLGEVYWLIGREEDAKTVWRQSWQQHADDPILQETMKKYQFSPE